MPERSRIPAGMPVAIAPCPVVSRPLNHRLFSLTPSGVDPQAPRRSCETEIPSYARQKDKHRCPSLRGLHRPESQSHIRRPLGWLKRMTTDRYEPERDITPHFVETVKGWLTMSSELFIVLRYLRAAGAKDYLFIHNEAEFRQLIDVCPLGTDIIVFRDPQLPNRGTVTPEFIAEMQNRIPDGAEYLIVRMSPEELSGLRITGDLGDTHADLVEDLSDIQGELVAVGLCPPFMAPDHDGMISVSKGGTDGPR